MSSNESMFMVRSSMHFVTFLPHAASNSTPSISVSISTLFGATPICMMEYGFFMSCSEISKGTPKSSSAFAQFEVICF